MRGTDGRLLPGNPRLTCGHRSLTSSEAQTRTKVPYNGHLPWQYMSLVEFIRETSTRSVPLQKEVAPLPPFPSTDCKTVQLKHLSVEYLRHSPDVAVVRIKVV